MAEQRRLGTILGHLKAADGSGISLPNAKCISEENRRPYRYTFDEYSAKVLSHEQRDFYEEKGFLVVKELVPPRKLEEYKERFLQFCSKEVEIPSGVALMKDVSVAKEGSVQGERNVYKVQGFQFDPVLSGYCRLPELLHYVECFTGPDIMAMHTMLINKPPDTGTKSSRHPMHQDLHYFSFRPADKIVCSWTAMEHVHRLNGCLVVVPGTHKTQLLPHSYPKWEGGVNKLFHGIHDYDPSHPRVHLEMQAGDTVFFHPLLIHGSGTNRSAGFRKAISTHFASSDCHYIDVKGTIQEELSKETMELVARKIGTESAKKLSLSNYWQYTGKCVKGHRINL